jgi:hypothetical protein
MKMMAMGLLNNIPMAPPACGHCIVFVLAASGYQHPLMTNQVKYILIQFSRFYLSVLVLCLCRFKYQVQK